MALGFGSKVFIGFKRETTYGTPVAIANGNYNRVRNAPYVNNGQQSSGNDNLGIPWAVAQRVFGLRGEGEISTRMHYQGFEEFLGQLFGTGCDAKAVSEVTVNTHVLTPKIAQTVGGTLEVHQDILKQIFPGTKVLGATFRFHRADPLEIAFKMFGQLAVNPTVAAEAAPTFLEDVALAGHSAIPVCNPIETTPGTDGFTFSIGDAGGTSYAVVGLINSELTIDKPHKTDRGNIGQIAVGEPVVNGQPIMTFGGSIEREFIDADLLHQLLGGTQKAFKWRYLSPTKIVDAGTAAWELIIESKYTRILTGGPSVDGAGPLSERIPFLCEAPSAVIPPITMTLVNRLATVAA